MADLDPRQHRNFWFCAERLEQQKDTEKDAKDNRPDH